MDRKIPPKNLVASIIKKILSSRLMVESQDELARLIKRELNKQNKNYVITPMRAKRIALELDYVEVKAKTKKSLGVKKISRCPVCGSPVKPIKVKNLLNKEITIGYKCTRCGYQSDLEAFVPMKYIFLLKT